MPISGEDERSFWARVWPALAKVGWRYKSNSCPTATAPIGALSNFGDNVKAAAAAATTAGSPIRKSLEITDADGGDRMLRTTSSSCSSSQNGTDCGPPCGRMTQCDGTDVVEKQPQQKQEDISDACAHSQEGGGSEVHDPVDATSSATVAAAAHTAAITMVTSGNATSSPQELQGTTPTLSTMSPKQVVFFPPPCGTANETLEEAMRRNLPADGSAGQDRVDRFQGIDAVVELLTQVPGYHGIAGSYGALNMVAIAAAAEAVSTKRLEDVAVGAAPPAMEMVSAGAGTDRKGGLTKVDDAVSVGVMVLILFCMICSVVLIMSVQAEDMCDVLLHYTAPGDESGNQPSLLVYFI